MTDLLGGLFGGSYGGTSAGDPFGFFTLEKALPDAWMLLHGMFAELKRGTLSGAEVIEEMEKIAGKAKHDEADDLFPEYYDANAEPEALAELLEGAIERMKERYGGK